MWPLVAISSAFTLYTITVTTIITSSCYRDDLGPMLIPPSPCPVITVITVITIISAKARQHFIPINHPLASIIFLTINPSRTTGITCPPPPEHLQPLSLPQSVNPRQHRHHYHYGHYHHRSANGLVITSAIAATTANTTTSRPGRPLPSRRRRRHMASQKPSSNGVSEGGQGT